MLKLVISEWKLDPLDIPFWVGPGTFLHTKPTVLLSQSIYGQRGLKAGQEYT